MLYVPLFRAPNRDYSNYINSYDRSVKDPQVRPPTCSPPSAQRMRVIYQHRKVNITIILCCNLVVEMYETALEPQVIPVECPEHCRRNHRYYKERSFRFDGGESR